MTVQTADTAVFSKRHDIEAIGLIASSHASSHFYHLVIPSLFPWIMRAFGLSFTEAGLLVSAFFVTSACGQAVSGFLVDRFGPRPVLCAGLLLLAASSIFVGSAASYHLLFVGAVAAGAGNSVFHPCDYSLINYNVSITRLGYAFAWHGIVGNLGKALSPVLMVALASFFGWRTAAFCASAMALLVLSAILLRRETLSRSQVSEKKEKTEKIDKASSTFGFLTVPAVWICFLFFFFTAGAAGILQSYGPTVFDHAYGLTLREASMALTVFLLAASAGGFLGGYFASNPEADSTRVVGAAFGLSAATAVLLATQWLTGWWVMVLVAFMGFGVGTAGPNRDVMIRSAVKKKLGFGALGRVYGFTYCGTDVGQSLSPVLFGPLLDAGHYSLVLAGIALFQTLGILCALNSGGGKENSEPKTA